MSERDFLSPVTIAHYLSAADAQLARTTLAGSGIQSWICEETLGGLDWRMGVALGGIRLQVLAGQVDEALEILELPGELPADAATPGEAAELAATEDRCPRCGSARIEESSVARRAKGVSMIFWPLAPLSFLVVALAGGRMICRECDYRWRPESEPS